MPAVAKSEGLCENRRHAETSLAICFYALCIAGFFIAVGFFFAWLQRCLPEVVGEALRV